MSPLSLLCLFLGFLISTVRSIPTIEAVGSKFFDSNGKQFFIKGVAYQLIEDDPLVDTEQCQRDAALLQNLGANTIRVYHVNGTADHSGCMNAFASVGIYLFVDLDSFKTYIRYADKSSWTSEQAASYEAVIDNFQQFDNTAGFFVGNEVLNVQEDSHAAPFLLAAAADMKKYRDSKGYRKIPIGYSATDTGALRPMLQDYLVCRPDEAERIDFYAVNTYSWCGPQTKYDTSGYPALQALAKDYPVPIWMSEDGCNTVPPRDFNDQNAVFGPEMVNTWSGAMIYEWIQELNHYGLVSYGPQLPANVQEGNRVVQGFTREGQPTPVQPDFDNLKQVWATISPTGVDSAAYAATFSAITRQCPSYTAGGWSVPPQDPLPTIGARVASSGMASGVPSGSITVTGIATASSQATQGMNATGIGQTSDAASGTGESAVTSTAGAARYSMPEFTYSGDGFGMTGMLMALLAAAVGFVVFL